ncbi:hypothetical protein LDENG_00033700, partial [Lucifuga dentata]
AAAHLLTRSTKRDHITPVLVSLRWPPVHFRINFKILLIVYKSLHLVPSYIPELHAPYSTTRPVRSTHRGMMAAPIHGKKKGRGQRFFFSSSALEQPVGLKTHFYLWLLCLTCSFYFYVIP